MSRPSVELSLPLFIKGSELSFRFPPRRRFPLLLFQWRREQTREQRIQRIQTFFFFFLRLFLSFELTFVLYVTNIDLYGDMVTCFRIST